MYEYLIHRLYRPFLESTFYKELLSYLGCVDITLDTLLKFPSCIWSTPLPLSHPPVPSNRAIANRPSKTAISKRSPFSNSTYFSPNLPLSRAASPQRAPRRVQPLLPPLSLPFFLPIPVVFRFIAARLASSAAPPAPRPLPRPLPLRFAPSTP